MTDGVEQMKTPLRPRRVHRLVRDFTDIGKLALGEPQDAFGIVGAGDLLRHPCFVVADVGPAQRVVEHRVLEEFSAEIHRTRGLVGIDDHGLAVGRHLGAANDHPFGFELGHGFGDNHGWLYPLLWSYGGAEVAADGKTVVIDSDETARAVDFCRKFFKDTMLDDVLGWTDVSNNKAWMAEQISCTNNAESILWFAKREFPEIGKVTDQAMNPAGPRGRFHLLNSISHSIFSFSPVREEARALMRWLMDPKQLGGWYAIADSYYQPLLHGYDNAPMWNVEPRNLPFRDSLASAHLPGWPAPASRQMAESVAKYVVVDMFAKACAGTSTKEVIKDAEGQLKGIYQSA